MGGLAWEGDGRELTGKTGAAASPARSPAAELELQALGSAGPGKRRSCAFFFLSEGTGIPPIPPYPTAVPGGGRPMPGNGRGLRGRSPPGPERGLWALRGAPPAAPYFRPCLSRPSAGQLCVRRTAPRKAATARVPKGSAAADTPKPLNFFSAADSAAITDVERRASGRRSAAVLRTAPGHLPAPSSSFSPCSPQRTPAPPAPAPWWPEPRGAVGAGRSRRAGAHPRPAGFARGPLHAPRARSTWPRAAECAPDPGDPAPAGGTGTAERAPVGLLSFPASGRPRRLPAQT